MTEQACATYSAMTEFEFGTLVFLYKKISLCSTLQNWTVVVFIIWYTRVSSVLLDLHHLFMGWKHRLGILLMHFHIPSQRTHHVCGWKDSPRRTNLLHSGHGVEWNTVPPCAAFLPAILEGFTSSQHLHYCNTSPNMNSPKLWTCHCTYNSWTLSECSKKLSIPNKNLVAQLWMNIC
jgi:hypothetical protein